ncbi:hypothetical protein ACFQJ7_04405 [Halovenus rubra]|uniref:Uncharacterized protein n=2 Tax=Halovenus rubra TaxID=869890 RepID=A0ABD5XA74_9EURY|nr:hypothetical protein [Halovenus rubra]
MALKRTVTAVVLFTLAAVILLSPVSGEIPLSRQLVYIIGLVVIALGVVYVWPGREQTQATPPMPETRAELSSPGESIEEQLDVLSGTPVRPDAVTFWKDTREEVSTHLHTLAVQTLAERYNLTNEVAVELIETGTWSQDPKATAFFNATRNENDGGPRAASIRSNVGQQARHVIDELGTIERGEQLLPDEAVTRPESLDKDGQQTGVETQDAGGPQ